MRGWAVNSDFYIVWLFGGFSFMTMPLFIALMMGDPVIRDFRIGIDPLIFSKPVRRTEYLLGKFFGNFFVLVCCQACFALTALLLQAFSTPGHDSLVAATLPLFPTLLLFRRRVEPRARGDLFYGRHAHAQRQNSLRPGDLFLLPLHRVAVHD